MQQPNFWTNRVSSTSAADLANNLQQLSVKTTEEQGLSDPSNIQGTFASYDTTSTGVVLPRTESKGILSSTATIVSITSESGGSGHVDNPQGGMKYGGMENGTAGITDPGSIVTASHSEDGKQDFSTGGGSQPRSHSSERHLMKVPPTKKDARKLFVGGIPSNVSDEEFRAFFEQFGEVIDSVVMYDRETHRSRGFGFVTFESLDTAESVLNKAREQNNKLNIHGKDCEVKAAEPKASNHDSHFHGHNYRDKRRGHDVRSAFAKVDQNRTPHNAMTMQAYPGYSNPYYSNVTAYQQQYYSGLAAANNPYDQMSGVPFASNQPSFEQDVQPYPPQPQGGAYPTLQYSPLFYQQSAQQQQYSPYGPAVYNGGGGYNGRNQEAIALERNYGQPGGYPYPGYQQNLFSPVGGEGGTPPPPGASIPSQHMVPNFVSVSPFQGASSYEMGQFGSDQSTSDVQGDESSRQFQE